MNPFHRDNIGAVEKWRVVALEFHLIRSYCATGTLPEDFGPGHLADLPCGPITPAERGVIAFLLHIWNTDYAFDLGQIQRWDRSHLRAFVAWATGTAAGEPCRYF